MAVFMFYSILFLIIGAIAAGLADLYEFFIYTFLIVSTQ